MCWPGRSASPRAPLRQDLRVSLPFPAPKVDFVGFGDGPGLGMGQWGAFGYATLEHKTYKWILAHYYGGTTLWSGASPVSDDPTISVDIDENDGHPVVVTSASAFSFGGHSFLPGQAARAVLVSGGWSLSEAPSCSSTQWTLVASQLADPVAVPSSLQPSATSSQLLTLCEHGGTALAVRGTVEAYDAPQGAVTLNLPPARGVRARCRLRRSDVVVGTLRRHQRVAAERALGLPGPRGAGCRHAFVPSPPSSSRADGSPTPPPATPTASPIRE